MTVYFSADYHIGHQRILELCNRPYPTIEEMNFDIIQRHNAVVKPTDTLWFLGDFGWHGLEDAFAQLNGEKHLIIGNHDSKRTFALPWASQHIYKELKLDGQKIILFHYPVEEWASYYKDSLHFHGHTHGTVPNKKNRWDVGVDVFDFTPVTLEQIVAKV